MEDLFPQLLVSRRFPDLLHPAFALRTALRVLGQRRDAATLMTELVRAPLDR